MYAIIKRDDNIAYNVNEYICDSMSDLDSLSSCVSSSIATVSETGNTMMFMKNAEGK